MASDILTEIENAFEQSKAKRMTAKHQLEAAKGKFHMELMARREAGETITAVDMKAMMAASIDTNKLVNEFYHMFVNADSEYRAAKVNWEAEKRRYWEGRGR